jgi:hypothetical protein
VGRSYTLSINRPTKRGKEKSPSDGHCQCEKEIQILETEPYSDTPYYGANIIFEG